MLVDEAALAIGSTQPGEVGIADQRRSRIERGRCPLVERAVRAVGVVMHDVVDEHCLSEEAVDSVSQSRTRDFAVLALSARSVEMLRACCVAEPATSLAVTPANCTRRVSWWMNTSR